MKTKLTTPLLWLAIAVCLLLVTALPSNADPPLPNIPATNFNVTSFGAAGNGTMNNATAIQNAINAAASVGGGTVVVAAVGVLTNYLSGPINLSNSVCLQINAGTKLQMLPMSTWPNASTPFINGANLHDVAITGSGTIDGNAGFTVGALANWWGNQGSNNPVATRPEFLNINSTTNLLVQGVTLQNPPVSHFVFKSNDTNVTIQGIVINTVTNSPNTDSEFVCKNMLIRNCTITCGDDDLVTLGADITVSNCTFNSGHGLSIGSFTTGGMTNLLVSNCTWIGTEYGIHMKSDRGRGGLVQNLIYRDLTMSNVNFVVAIYSYYVEIGAPSHVINVSPFMAATDVVQTVTSTTPIWRNITISNVTASTVGGIGNIAGIIWGLPEMLVSNVVLSHINFTDATNTFCIYNARGIQIIDSNLATPTATNTLTLYNADITVTNSALNAKLVTLGGLAVPPTNNTLAFFNGQIAITDTNELGAAPITLGGSTLTLTEASVSVSNNISVTSSSTMAFTSGVNKFAGTFNGPLTLNLPTGALLFYGSGTFAAGGAPSAFANLTVGDCGLSIDGSVTVAGGTLYVTNAAHNAVLDVRDGTFTITSGSVVVDKLVMTNACGLLVPDGGTLVVGSVLLDANLSALGDGIPNGWKQQYNFNPLDPNVASEDSDGDGFSNLQEYLAGTDPTNSASSFRITSIVPQGNDMRITWSAATNKTYLVQAAPHTPDGSFTNAFTNLGTVTVPATPAITATNYLDIGGATNFPSRFYRVWLVP